MMQNHCEWFAGSKICQSHNVDAVIFLHLVVIVLIGKGQCQHTLLLQVGLVDPGE